MSYRLLIDGNLVDGAAGTLDVINPATGVTFATCARADEAQLEKAIAAAKRAFPEWAALSHVERRDYLYRLAEVMEARQSEFTNLLILEQGKPFIQAGFEVGGSIAALRYFGGADLPLKIIRETLEEKIIEQRMPLGVVAGIAPSNFPLGLMVMKIAPALAIGNTMIAKPSPSTPLTAALFGEMAVDILPPGVLNVIIDANDLGRAITEHVDIAKVSFTGSTTTGKRIIARSADTLKRLTLELGGNDAAIILDDADISEVAPKVFAAAMLNAGQACVATKRIYAPAKMYDALCEELVRLSREAVVDSGLNHGAQIGPVQSKQCYDKILELIEDARGQGEVLAGGYALNRCGYFIVPTVIGNLPDNSRLAREEQFGPVMPVFSYDTVEEVIARANDSEYGLACTIWTSDIDRGMRIAMKIQTGTVWINKSLDIPLDIPFGGAKKSGFGVSQGIEGIKEYTQLKIINVAKRMKI